MSPRVGESRVSSRDIRAQQIAARGSRCETRESRLTFAGVRPDSSDAEPLRRPWLDSGSSSRRVDLRVRHPWRTESFVIRVARPSDARHVHGLLRSYAERGLLRHRSLDEIGRTIKGFVVAVDCHGQVVGCGALRVHSDNVAEIAALAVDESRHGQGVGERIVRTLECEARMLGIRRVFARTLQHGFFHKLGFSATNVHEFPETIDWGARNG